MPLVPLCIYLRHNKHTLLKALWLELGTTTAMCFRPVGISESPCLSRSMFQRRIFGMGVLSGHMLVSTPIRYLTPYRHSRHTLSILSTCSHVYHHPLFHLLIIALFYWQVTLAWKVVTPVSMYIIGSWGYCRAPALLSTWSLGFLLIWL